jgi:hypothetical protein
LENVFQGSSLIYSAQLIYLRKSPEFSSVRSNLEKNGFAASFFLFSNFPIYRNVGKIFLKKSLKNLRGNFRGKFKKKIKDLGIILFLRSPDRRKFKKNNNRVN